MQKKNESQFATKSDLRNLEQRVNEGFESMDQKLDKLQNTLDGFVGVVDNLRIENEVGADQIRELRERGQDHEKRIAKLESTSGN